MFLRRAVKFYVSWLYLVTLLRNAVVAAFGATYLYYNHSGGRPDWNLLLILFIAAFAESLLEHIGNAKFLNLLLLIWQALQQLNPSSMQQMLILLQNIQPNAKMEDRPTRQTPAIDGTAYRNPDTQPPPYRG